MAEDCTGADRDWVYRCSPVETIPTRYGRPIEELTCRSCEGETPAHLALEAGNRRSPPRHISADHTGAACLVAGSDAAMSGGIEVLDDGLAGQ